MAGKTQKEKKKKGKNKKGEPQGTGWMNELRAGRSVSLEFFKANACSCSSS